MLPLQYYVTCALGIHFVGYVMICFGATNSVSSFTVGKLSQYTGRFALFTFGKEYSNEIALKRGSCDQRSRDETYTLTNYKNKLPCLLGISLLVLSSITAAVINLAGALTFLLWKPHPDELPVFFVLPALWGLADAIWQTQTNGKFRFSYSLYVVQHACILVTMQM